jgi:dolichol-phosphate mannosyltransferase
MIEKKSIVIIPTFNELENIQKLIPDILGRYSTIDILVVDDNSPDGTGDYVDELSKTSDRVNLIRRAKKMGLGTAYIEGFKFALQKDYDFIFEMDADYSHDPRELKNFLRAAEKYDLILGSRYLMGVNVVHWPMRRLLLSYFANFYTRIVTGLPIHDATGGFKCFGKKVLESINLDNVKSNGYAFQIEMTFKAWKKGFKIGEIPIIFIDRTAGSSKMSKRIVREAIFMVWKLRLRSALGLL